LVGPFSAKRGRIHPKTEEDESLERRATARKTRKKQNQSWEILVKKRGTKK